MSSAPALRAQIEATLADRILSALTPAIKPLREVAPTGIPAIDALVDGGLPVGAVTEMIGLECSGRTTLALAFVAQITKAEKVCAWVDVSNALSPDSAAASGVDLHRLLWIRCGVDPSPTDPAPSSPNSFALPAKYLSPPPAKRGLHGGGFGPHPRSETRGLPEGISHLLQPNPVPPQQIGPRCAEPQPRLRPLREQLPTPHPFPPSRRPTLAAANPKPWSRIAQALRVTDLLLQAGGFSAIVLDLGSIPPEHVSRIPLATWFRYAAAAKRSRASVLLLTQHPSAKSSAGLVLRLHAGQPYADSTTVLTGLERHVEISRQRLTEPSPKVVPLRKPPQRATAAGWQSETTWAQTR